MSLRIELIALVTVGSMDLCALVNDVKTYNFDAGQLKKIEVNETWLQ